MWLKWFGVPTGWLWGFRALHFNAQTEKSLITFGGVLFFGGANGRCTWQTKRKTFCAFYAIS